jgi:hypothetical protein
MARYRVGRLGSRVGGSGARTRQSAQAMGAAPAVPRACELASPFLANAVQMSFAGLGNPPQSPPARGRHCDPVGGYMRREGGRAARGSKKTVMAGFGSRWLRCPTPLPTLGFLLAREPIFSETHTNEFCGIGKSTPEPAGTCAPLRPGRWVYEGKERKPLWGGCRVASAPLHGSLRRPLLVPFHNSPLSRGALRSAGVPTISASTTPAPLLPWRSGPGKARHLGRLRPGAREYPMCAEGWALWVLGRWPDLYLATGGTYRLGKPQG